MPDTPDCIDLRAALSAYVDDELEPARRHVLERHLSECPDCRALVDETERLGDLVAADLEREMPSELPDGFAGHVLARTVHEDRRRTGAPWLNRFGWLAAAAALALAATAWLQQNQGTRPAPAVRPNNVMHVAQAHYAPKGRSWVLEESELADAATNAPADRAVAVAPEGGLDPASRDTLHAAGLLVAELAEADVDSFSDVESVRRIAVYDDILPRLRDARSHLDPMDRTVVLAAESLLHRVVNGPIDQRDLQELRDTAARSALAGALLRIGGADGWSV